MSFTNTPASNSSRPADDQAPEQDWSEIMLPPQISTFGGTGLQLFQYLQDWAASHHYALVIARSEKQPKSNDYHTMTFRCDRGPKVKESVAKSMQSTSRKVECPFEIRAGYSKIHMCWTIRYICNKHSNHPPSDNPSSHSVLRRLNPLEKDRVYHLQEAGVQPREVHAILRNERPDSKASMDTIYNANFANSRELLGNKTPFEALVNFCKDENFTYKTQTDSSGNLTGFIFAHPESLALFKHYHYVLIMDSTYKTNAFNWLLFHVVSQTPFGSNFTIYLCFIKTETIPQFTWILTQIKQIMLQLGCSPPCAIVTDRDLALTAAMDNVFSSTP